MLYGVKLSVGSQELVQSEDEGSRNEKCSNECARVLEDSRIKIKIYGTR